MQCTLVLSCSNTSCRCPYCTYFLDYIELIIVWAEERIGLQGAFGSEEHPAALQYDSSTIGILDGRSIIVATLRATHRKTLEDVV
jgi:hypothetical protein